MAVPFYAIEERRENHEPSHHVYARWCSYSLHEVQNFQIHTNKSKLLTILLKYDTCHHFIWIERKSTSLFSFCNFFICCKVMKHLFSMILTSIFVFPISTKLLKLVEVYFKVNNLWIRNLKGDKSGTWIKSLSHKIYEA